MSIKVCKGYPDRTVEPNCHMECERYLKAVEEHHRLMELERMEKETDYTLAVMAGHRRRG